jgi:hypothetical protein
MPRKKVAPATLTSIIDVPSDDDLAFTEHSAMIPTPESIVDKKPITTKRQPAAARTKTAAAKTTAATRKVAHSTTVAQKKRGRPALKDLTNVTEEDDEEMELEPERKKCKQSKPAAERNPTKTASRNARAGSAVPQIEVNVIQETQAEPSIEVDEFEVAAPIAQPVQRGVSRARSISRQRSVSRQPEPLLSRHLRAGSASSVERGLNDPALRRRLGEMTNKYESLEIKYNNLKDVASAEAQSNFDKLKASTDLRTKSEWGFENKLFGLF